MRDQDAHPIVGRAQLLGEILTGLRTDDAGVLLVGEMGVGKTRLLAEIVSSLEADGWLIRHAMTSSSTSSIPFGALSALLPRLPMADLRLMLETVRHRLVDQAGGRPQLLMVDDAHLLDEASAALLHQMVVAGSAGAVVTQRTGEPVSETITALWKDGHLVRRPVPPLSRVAHDVLAESMLGVRTEPSLAAHLWHRTQGNPLFLRELVLAAVDTGAITRRDGVGVLTGGIELPERLVEIVEARMSRLDRAQRRALEIVAVGEPIDLRVAAKGLSLDAVESLERIGLVHVVDEGDRRTLRTAHPLQGETLRASLPTATTTRIRLELARELGRSTSLPAPDLIRAVEWTMQAGERPDVEVAVRAAGAALGRSDPALAERFARAAIEADPRHPAATRLLGASLSAQGVRQPATNTLRRAFELSRSDDDRVDGALARSRHLLWILRDLAAADDALRTAVEVVRSEGGRAELRAEQAIITAVAGDLPETIRVAQEVLDAPEASNRAILTALIQSTLARCMLGRYDALDADLERGRELAADLMDDVPLAATQLDITDLMYRHYIRIDEALRDARAGHESAIRHGRPASLWSTTSAWMQIDRGAASEAVTLARLAITEARRFDPYNMNAMAQCLLSIGLGMLGRQAEARAALAAAGPPDALEPRTRTWFDRATTWATAAEGRVQEAAEHAATTGRRAVAAGLRTWGASLLFDAVRLGHPEAVAAPLRDLAREQPPPLVQAFAASAAGCVDGVPAQLEETAERLVRAGALVPAAATLDAAGTLLLQGRPEHAERVYLRAWLLRDACQSHDEPRRVRPRSALTAREVQVARQAGAGRTSRDIAADLGVSPRTVDNHLAGAYRKLGVTGRVELGRVVPEAVLSSPSPRSE